MYAQFAAALTGRRRVQSSGRHRRAIAVRGTRRAVRTTAVHSIYGVGAPPAGGRALSKDGPTERGRSLTRLSGGARLVACAHAHAQSGGTHEGAAARRLALWRERGGGGGAMAHGVPRTTHRPAAATGRRDGAASLRSTRRLRAGACCQWTTPKGPPARAPYLAARDFAAFAHRRTVGRRPRRGCVEAARAVAREGARAAQRRTACHARLTARRQ